MKFSDIKLPCTKECIQSDSIYIKYKTRQNCCFGARNQGSGDP